MEPRALMAITPGQRAEIFSKDALARLEDIVEMDYYEGTERMPREELLSRIGRFQALITCWGSPRLDPEALNKASLLRLVCHSAGSVRPYICREVFERGITVTNASSAIAVSVAETTIAFMLTSLRHLHDHNRALRRGGNGRTEFGPVHELTARRVGLVGFGQVGRRVADLLRAFDCEVLVYDPYRAGRELQEVGCQPSSLENLMKESDIVSIHAPNIPANRHMIDGALLGSMKEGALLVNTARGDLIDEEAMLQEVLSGRIQVALDVFEAEASVVATKLKGSRDAFLTPHIAGLSVEARRRQGDVVAEDVARFFSGKEPRNLVTMEMLEWMA